MHLLEEHILRRLRETGMPTSGDLLVAGVSGGVDSVALLHLLAAVADELKFGLCAVYVDHGLRPDESAAEAELVERLAARLGASFRTGRVAVRDYAEERGRSIEAAARTLRYRFLEETAGELGAAAIVVAHTADDQAEEVLLRLIRGTGRGGLAGMVPVNYRQVIRPLLQVTKARLLDYLRARKEPFLEDSSNLERDFLRNRVRLDLLPYLEKHFNPAIRRNLLRTAEILRGEEELLDQLSGELYRRAVSPVEAAGILRIDSGGLAAGHQALQRRVIEMVLVELDAQPSFQHIDKVLALAVRGTSGGELHLPEGLRVIKRGPVLEFSHPAGRKRHRAGLAACGELSFEKVIEGAGRWPIQELGLTLLVEVLDKAPGPGELSGVAADYLDMAELSFPLAVRTPRPGDRFHPLGGPGSRKVADFLSDCKVAREERGRVPVLTSGGRIVALLGMRIDHRCRLGDNSRKVLKVSVLPR